MHDSGGSIPRKYPVQETPKKLPDVPHTPSRSGWRPTPPTPCAPPLRVKKTMSNQKAAPVLTRTCDALGWEERDVFITTVSRVRCTPGSRLVCLGYFSLQRGVIFHSTEQPLETSLRALFNSTCTVTACITVGPHGKYLHFVYNFCVMVV